MPPSSSLSQSEALAQLCKAAGDTLRLEIIRALKNDSFGVLELSDIFAMRQSGMSHHLKVLSTAGILCTRREGNSIFYRRTLADTNSTLGGLLKTLFQAIDQTPLSETVFGNIEAIKEQRAEAARSFFNRIADDLDRQQEMIALPEHYLDSTRAVLDQCPPCKEGLALEIGPGDGRFLATLASRYDQVVALDISEEMLAKAGQFCQEHALQNVRLIRGDTHEACREGLKADRIVCNMVLHHVPSPADMFADSAKILRKNGSFIVTDLCRHEQQWARDRCGDLWLGFEPEELNDWASAAGLIEQEGLYLGLRNGFQVQVRRFDKQA